MNPLNICLSLPSTIASRDKNPHSFQQRPYWFRCRGIWLFSARAAAEQSILSRSYTFIFFPVSLQQLCSRGLSHPTMELSTDKSTPHTPVQEGQCKKAAEGGLRPAGIHIPMGEHTGSSLPSKNTQKRKSQLELNYLTIQKPPSASLKCSRFCRTTKSEDLLLATLSMWKPPGMELGCHHKEVAH